MTNDLAAPRSDNLTPRALHSPNGKVKTANGWRVHHRQGATERRLCPSGCVRVKTARMRRLETSHAAIVCSAKAPCRGSPAPQRRRCAAVTPSPEPAPSAAAGPRRRTRRHPVGALDGLVAMDDLKDDSESMFVISGEVENAGAEPVSFVKLGYELVADTSDGEVVLASEYGYNFRAEALRSPAVEAGEIARHRGPRSAARTGRERSLSHGVLPRRRAALRPLAGAHPGGTLSAERRRSSARCRPGSMRSGSGR